MALNHSYNQEYTFVFHKLPKTVDELLSLPEARLDTPFKTAALAMLSLCVYKENKELCFEMLNALKGPAKLSPFEIQFLNDRLKGKEYKPYSFPEENYATLFVHSSGADSDREIKLRLKPSTKEWFLTELLCLSDIRIPNELDPWA